jgi:plasmid stabilization system protein ParE
MVPEVEAGQIREVMEGPYRIIYLVQPTRIDVVAIVHGRQDLHWPP